MFFTDASESRDGKVAVVGEFSEIDGSHVVLKVGEKTIRVQHNGLDSYKTKRVLVNGHFEHGILVEESVQEIDDEFDFPTFLRLAKVSSRYPEIF